LPDPGHPPLEGTAARTVRDRSAQPTPVAHGAKAEHPIYIARQERAKLGDPVEIDGYRSW
jgi:hypothetical protein